MNIPKYIENILKRREKLDNWLEKNGADFTDSDICESTNARSVIENYIEDKL